VGNNEKIGKLAGSIPGVNIKLANEISVLDLVPGSKPIRLTIFSENGLEQLKQVKAPLNRVMEMIHSK
jgi:large subunit ribosomal protein L4e